jgi:broad specificity phosphatase PhoE
MKTAKELYIFRHAEKDLSASGDPALSHRGTHQAENLAKSIELKTMPHPDKLWVSPRQRAKETFEPLHKMTGLILNIDADLDQRKYQETSKEFAGRIRNFTEDKLFACSEKTIYICTHSDWIESLGWVAPLKDSIDFNELILPSAHYLHFRYEKDGTWSFHSRGGFD